MTIPDEAFHAAIKVLYYANPHDVTAALTAALPFLQGVKVKTLAWQSELPFHVARTSFGGFYCIEAVWNENDFVHVKLGGPLLRDRTFQTVKDAKAAAQADYEARILSAIEPSACKTCNGRGIIGGIYRVGDGDVDGWEQPCPDCAPFPRAQALEEAARNACMYLETGFIECPKCGEEVETKHTDAECALRSALSSQPVADGWLRIETAPKDGTVIDLWSSEFGRQSDCFWGKREHHCGEAGQYCDSDWHSEPDAWIDSSQNTQTFDDVTHWRHLPASPGASE